MNTSNHHQEFNPINYFLPQFRHGTLHGHNKLGKKSLLLRMATHNKVIKGRINRYNDLPFNGEETPSRLYYINSRNLLNVEFLHDEITYMTQLINKSPLLKIVSYNTPRVQLIKKQLTFLSMQKDRILNDLRDYKRQLTEMIMGQPSSNIDDLKNEQARINSDIKESLNMFAFTKTCLYTLIKSDLPSYC